jgi:hypothetical protein
MITREKLIRNASIKGGYIQFTPKYERENN